MTGPRSLIFAAPLLLLLCWSTSAQAQGRRDRGGWNRSGIRSNGGVRRTRPAQSRSARSWGRRSSGSWGQRSSGSRGQRYRAGSSPRRTWRVSGPGFSVSGGRGGTRYRVTGPGWQVSGGRRSASRYRVVVPTPRRPRPTRTVIVTPAPCQPTLRPIRVAPRRVEPTRPQVVVIPRDTPGVLIEPAPVAPRRIPVAPARPAPEEAPVAEAVRVAEDLRAAEPVDPTYTGRTATPRSGSAKRPALSERLLGALEAGDLAAACRLAAWTRDDPRREQALQAALFRRFPSPQLLAGCARRLATDASLRDTPGRATLARLLGPAAEDDSDSR